MGSTDKPSGWIREFWRMARATYKTVRNAQSMSRVPPSIDMTVDLALTHGFQQFPIVQKLSKAQTCKYIYDAADIYSTRYERKHFLVRPFLLRLERAAIRRADVILTASEGQAAFYRKVFGVDPIVVRNCQDLRSTLAPEQTIREVLEIPDEELLVVAVCRPSTGRAVEQAILSAGAWPEGVHLAFVGRGYEGWEDRLSDSGPQARVRFLPPVHPQAVVPFISTADLFLMTNYPATTNDRVAIAHGFFQAIAAGLPLLYSPQLSEVSRLAELHHVGMPIDPLQPESITDAINSLAADGRLLRRYATASELAAKELCWEREEARLIQVFQKLLAT